MKRIFYFLSKTDRDVISECTKQAKSIQISLGIFVLLTGILAFASGTFAVSNMFIDFDIKTNELRFNPIGYVMAPLIGFFYALMIIFIDREVVSAGSKWAVAPRFLLAIIIGVIVAVPMELKLLEGSITKKLLENFQEENKEIINKRTADFSELSQNRKKYEEEISGLVDKRQFWSDRMEQESVGRKTSRSTGLAGEGPAYREASRNLILVEEELSIARDNLEHFDEQRLKDRSESIENEFHKNVIAQEFDLLAKYKAMHQIAEEDETGTTSRIIFGISFLFIFFEVIPSFMKIITSKTEYDSMLEARRRINIQLTHKVANEGMDEIDFDLESALENQTLSQKHSTNPLSYLQTVKDHLIR